MAEGAPYIECDSAGLLLHVDSDVLEMLNALLVVDGTGYGLRVANRSTAEGSISLALACGGPLLTLKEILQKIIVESASGKPALSLIEEA